MGQKLIHKHSNVQGKLPSGNTLEHGEIAVNYNSTEPFISIRKNDNEYVRFIDESAVDAKIKIANDTIQNLEKEMLDNEEVVASALTDLDSRLNNKSEIGHNHDGLYVTEAQVDDKIKNIGGNVTSRIGFGKIQINDDATTIDADLDVDTLTIAQGNGITLTQDITNDKFTISVTDGVFADKEHFHDEYLKSIPSEYVTESEVNELISGKAEADHNHDGLYMTEAQVDDKVKTVKDSLDEVKEDIIDIEEITANALTDLDSRLNTKAEADHNHDGVYMTEAQVDDKLKDKTYDDRYYTESEVDALLNGKADVDHNHDDEYVTDAEVDDKLKTVQNSVNELEALVEENEIVTANALTDLDSRLNTKADAEHNHDGVYMTEAQVDDKLKDKNYDDRYYTESEVDNLLNNKSDADHNHDGVYMTETQVDDKVKTVQNSLEELKQGVIDIELVTANALNNLDGRLNIKADAEHNHNDIYYTESEITELLKSKSNTGHVHTKSEITDFAHDHDDRYYTESEVDTLLGGKSNTGHNHKKADITDFAHTHSKSEITDFAHNHGTLTLTGDVSGSATINNTNTTVTVAVADDSHNHKASNITDFTSAVDDRINTKLAANDAMLFKGTLGTNGTITSLPATHNAGWTYKVITAGTYAGQKCEVGDLVMCITDGTAASDSHWTVVQTNTDGHVTGPANATSNEIAIFDGTTGKLIKGSGYETGSFALKGHGHGTLSVSGDVSGSASINSGGTSISLSYNKSATTSQAGVVQLSDSVSSTASTKAATEKAVKTAYDKGVEAYNLANGKWSKTTASSGATGISKLITGDVNGKTYADGEAAAAAHTHSQYANQNAFSNVVVGSTTISADNATDTLTLVAGTNITLTPDANSDKITINGPDLSGYLKSHQTIYNLTASAGTFSAITFDPNGGAATINVPTHTSHLINNSGYITSGTTVKNAQNADKVNNLTVATAVPANAVFTDSKVTSVGNHYTPNSSTTLSASASSATDITNGSGVNVVTGLNIDAAGHVVSVNSAKLKSTDTNTTYTIGNGTITIKQNGTSKGTFTVNQTGNTTIELTDTNTDTNTDTKVTSVGNHYTPSSSTTIGATSGNNYIRGLYVDAAGHVTSVATGTPTDTNTNTWRPITDTWNGTSSDTSVSQKGVTAAYTEATGYADGVYDTVINIFDTHGVKYDDILTTAIGEFCGLKASGGKVGLSLWDCPLTGHTDHGRWLTSAATIQTPLWGGVPTNDRYYPVTVSYDGYLACYVPWKSGGSAVDTSGFVLTSGSSKVSGTTYFNKVCISATSATYGTGATLYFGDSETEAYIRNTADKDLTVYASGTLNLSGGTVKINGSAISSSDEKVKSVTGTSKYYLLGTSSSATTTGTTYKHGSVYMSAGTMTCNAYYQGSDERLKDFGDEIEINFDSLKKIPKVYYSWKADDKKEKQIGTSAQKVRDIYPELVGGTDKDMLSVDYARLSVIALKAIDVLHEENEKLRNIIEEMDERIKKLENK